MVNKPINALTRFSMLIEGFDLITLQKIFDAYDTLDEHEREFSFQRDALRNAFPELFARSVIVGQGKELMLSGDAEGTQRCTVLHHEVPAELIAARACESDKHFQQFRKTLDALFPQGEYIHDFRIKERDSLHRNINVYGSQRSLLDIIGFRVVPRCAQALPDMIRRFEEAFGHLVLQKLNTIAYENAEIIAKISEHSLYYRAVHYYVPFEQYFVEIQFRTPAVDVWSKLHHATIYKPRVQISDAERVEIIDFGRICNLVDYAGILQGNSVSKKSLRISRYNVAAVIMNAHGEVLLCKRSMKKRIAPGHWHLPGGKIDSGETSDGAIARELAEELDVVAVDIQHTSVKFIYPIGDEIHQTYYVKVIIDGGITLNDENDAYLYVRPKDLSRYLPEDWCAVAMKAIRA